MRALTYRGPHSTRRHVASCLPGTRRSQASKLSPTQPFPFLSVRMHMHRSDVLLSRYAHCASLRARSRVIDPRSPTGQPTEHCWSTKPLRQRRARGALLLDVELSWSPSGVPSSARPVRSASTPPVDESTSPRHAPTQTPFARRLTCVLVRMTERSAAGLRPPHLSCVGRCTRAGAQVESGSREIGSRED